MTRRGWRSRFARCRNGSTGSRATPACSARGSSNLPAKRPRNYHDRIKHDCATPGTKEIMSEQTQPFSLGLTYWPRRTAFGWWQADDRGATHDELAHVAALGCDTVRFCLRWEDFQPGPQRLNSAALNTLEHALDTAGD